MKKFNFLFFLTIFLCVLNIFPENVQAQDSTQKPEKEIITQKKDLYEGFNIEMPNIPFLTKEEIIEKMQFFEKKKPSDDEYSGYRVFIPKNWYEAPEELIRNTTKGDRIIGEVGTYYSNPNDIAKSEVVIEAHELEHNISAKNWLLKYILDRGYVLEGIKEYEWDRAEALGVIYQNKNIDYKDRIVVQINGKRVIVMTYSSPIYYWEDEKALQATVAKSFKILKHEQSFQNEMLTYDIIGYAEFMYPENWKLGVLNQSDFDRPSLKLINFEDYNEDLDEDGRKDSKVLSKGIINIQVVIFENAGTSLADEIEKQKELAENLGVKPSAKLKHDFDLVFPSSTKVNKFDIYEGIGNSSSSSNYEVWIAYMQTDEAYYLVTMLTPDRETRYFAWVENKSAFEAIVSSLEPISFYEE